MGQIFSCPNSLFSTLFLTWGPDGIQGALQTPPEVVFKWFGHVFDHFLMHLGTRLKGKSTVAEQRGCALDTPRQAEPARWRVKYLGMTSS